MEMDRSGVPRKPSTRVFPFVAPTHDRSGVPREMNVAYLYPLVSIPTHDRSGVRNYFKRRCTEHREMENHIIEYIDWNAVRVPCSPAICAVCASNPGAHSVYVRGSFPDPQTGEEIPIVYTQPSEAEMYYQHNEINTHFVNLVRTLHPRPWAWVFNAEGLGMKHMIDPRPGIKLAVSISSEFQDSLHSIYIMNANMVLRTSMAMLKPFLSSNISSKIKTIAPIEGWNDK